MSRLADYFVDDTGAFHPQIADPIPLGHPGYGPRGMDEDPPDEEEYEHVAYTLGEGINDPSILKAIFVLGPGGSGKGTISKEMFAGRGLKYVNQDTHLERLLADAGIPLRKVGQDYGLFKRAQDLARKERDAYAQQRLGLHIEVTGWDYKRIASPVQKLRLLGYDCYAIIIDVTEETALARNWERGQSGGRLVPKSYVQTAVRGLKENTPRYVQLFGKSRTLIVQNDTPIEPTHFRQVVAPKLTAIGDKILARPIENKIGQAWLKAQREQQQGTARLKLALPFGHGVDA